MPMDVETKSSYKKELKAKHNENTCAMTHRFKQQIRGTPKFILWNFLAKNIGEHTVERHWNSALDECLLF